MKRFILIAALTLPLLFASCKRNYVCECTTSYEGADTSYSDVTSSTEYERMKEDEAINKCNENDDSQTIVTETKTVDCEIK